MNQEITCEKCDHEFDAIEWQPSTCPSCGAEFYWDSETTFDEDGNLEDEYIFVVWE